ncbi:uncharacterized protein LOC127251578 [Andrographis paniculata]|uniref:uncharacterized protein LOC127251578 n=1 Tax=Andrographis paniculata TaxID=175694 RepID=UPI0021E720B5|nr:uncharacterized protein LOC127251578 [Andrographis paniculata]
MGKQSKSKKTEIVGKGKVTPVQIAFIVDRYLSDNGFAKTRTTFRSEAANLISKSPVEEAPKSLLSLGAILDEYITLKEHKVWVEQERCRLEQEKLRVQNLLSGLQDAMNSYNASGNNVVTPPPPLPPPVAPSGSTVSQAERVALTPAGSYAMHTSPAIMSTSKPLNTNRDPTVFSTPIMYNTTTKRKGTRDASNAPVNSKRSRRSIQPKDANLVAQTSNSGMNQEKFQMSSDVQIIAYSNASAGAQVHGSNVVKRLFNKETDSPSPTTNTSVPKTPPLASSQTEKSSSPIDICSAGTSNNGVPQQIVSANRTIISSETIRVSPTKQVSYYTIEKSSISACSPLKKCSPLKRSNVKDHVKGRLDFGTCEMPAITENQMSDYNTSESEKEGNILDLGFGDLDTFDLDFNFSEFLENFDLGTDGMCLSSEQGLASSPDSISGSPSTTGNPEMNTTPFSSNMTGMYADEGINFAVAGPESIEAFQSVTKCIRIVSPVKSKRCNLDQ